MDNGALPVPQGLMALLGGLLPARQGGAETPENRNFQDLLAQVLAGGTLTLEGADGADVPRALLPLLAATDGNSLPPGDAGGPPAGDAAADLEALLALLGVQPLAPTPVAPGSPRQAPGVPGQVPLPVAGGAVEMVSVALPGAGQGSGAATGGGEPAGAVAAGGADKAAILPLQSLPTPPPAATTTAAITTAPLDPVAAAEAGQTQNPGSGRASEQAVPVPPRPVDSFATGAVIQTPVSRPEWGHELGQRVLWMTGGHGGQQAELKLNPPQLGPLEVRVVVRNDEVSVFFNAHHAVTREALEQALPRLREMFGANGIQLAEANVSGGRDGGDEGAAFGHDRDGSGGGAGNGPSPEGSDHEPGGPSRLMGTPSRGLVDTYV